MNWSHAVCLALVLGSGCTDSGSATDSGAMDSGATDSGSNNADASVPTDAKVDAAVADAGNLDAAPSQPDAGGLDAEPGDAPVLDAGNPPVVGAVVGSRCNYQQRIGTIEINGESGPRYVNASLFDRPAPWFGPPASTTVQCVFHQTQSTGCTCSGDLVCDYQGNCVSSPAPIAGAELKVLGTSESQPFTGDEFGSIYGEVTLTDESLGLEITAYGTKIQVPAMSIPGTLMNVQGTLGGSYDAPTSVDVEWDPVAGAFVYTHIDINHHVRNGTFTECVAESDDGTIRIEQNMLTPLAVVTGLEFQGIEHVQFAAAQLREGCVEIRFTRRTYLSLE